VYDFAKFDGAENVSLQDDEQAGMEAQDDEQAGMEAFTEMLKEALESAAPPELDNYYAYKIHTKQGYYYPRHGTLRVLPTGWVLFVDELNSNAKETIYLTIQHNDIVSITWLPKPEVENPAAEVFPRAA